MNSNIIHEREDGKFVVATYLATKGRYRSNYTRDKKAIEAQSLDQLITAVAYSNRESAQRAIRKRRVKLK